ncbi:MAG: HDIG domain-containing protein [Clostridia bacterium]|nr:HDIG domain-containing protein [Clostridia bacterium]
MSDKKMLLEKWTKMKPYFYSLLIGVLGFTLIYIILFNVVAPKRHNLVVGEIAQSTITATKDIEDEVTTRARIEEARSSVESIIKQDDNVLEATLQDVSDTVAVVLEYRTNYQNHVKLYKTAEMDTYMPSISLIDDFLEALKPCIITRDEAVDVLMASDARIVSFTNTYKMLIEETIESGIMQEDLESTRARFDRELKSGYYNIAESLIPLANTMTEHYLRANLSYDETATELARAEAEAAVVPVIYKKGQNIVVANEIVTQAQYEVVSKLGLLEDATVDINLYIGLALIVVLVFLNIVFYMLMLEKELLKQPKMICLIITVFLIVIILGIFIRYVNVYLIPVQLSLFLLAILMKPRLAIICNAVLAVLVGILATGDEGLLASGMFNLLLVSVISGTLTVYLTRRANQRVKLLYNGLIVAVMNFATMCGVGLMTMASIKEVLIAAAYSAGSGILSAMLTMAFMPLLESVYSIVTPQKLMELSDPNHPLLRRLQLEAPGTYQHCLLVANLAESAAHEIGANELLARVGAYYHDVGKLKRPVMFKENQIGEVNPHDTMDPYVSASVITSHTIDGVALAQKYKLPKAIEDIIRQHHGKTAASYFYITAKKNAEAKGENSDNVDIKDFSYEGPKPNGKETAIVFLADTAEAATRSLKRHTPEDIEAMVRKLIRGRLVEGDLDDAPLTLAEIEKTTQAFLFVLNGFYHNRVAYPELDKKDPKAIPQAEPAAKKEVKENEPQVQDNKEDAKSNTDEKPQESEK